jgi:hypothetical protein
LIFFNHRTESVTETTWGVGGGGLATADVLMLGVGGAPPPGTVTLGVTTSLWADGE